MKITNGVAKSDAHRKQAKKQRTSLAPSDIERAYLWAESEIRDFGVEIFDKIRITNTENFSCPPDMTISLFLR